MKYMLLIYSPENAWSNDEWHKCVADSMRVCQQLNAQNQLIDAAPLLPVATGVTVRVRDEKPLVIAGPFAETTEQLGGYYLIDVPDLDAAIEVAERLPPAAKGTVEIRPLQELAGLPESQPIQTSGDQKLYMFLCYDNQPAWEKMGSEALDRAQQRAVELTHQLAAAGQYVMASPLHWVSAATSVRVREGKRLVTDGPFAETNEFLGGFYLLRARSADELLQIAAQHPGLPFGSVEIRQVVDIPRLPKGGPDEIISCRDLPVTPQQIFDAFRDPARLARWWGPKGFRNTFETFDFRPNGEWRFVMHGPDGKDYKNHHVFGSIEPPGLISGVHTSGPKFDWSIRLTELMPGVTRIVWRLRLESKEMRDRVATYAIPANEENIERLLAEIGVSA